jgi:N-acetylneuraminic acid mutarotase
VVFRSGPQRTGGIAAVGGLLVLAMTSAHGIAFAGDEARPSPREAPSVLQRPLGTWQQTRPLVAGRARPSATVLADGRVLIVGGKSEAAEEGVTSGAELWDPHSETSTALPRMAVARYEHTVTLLPDGRVAVVGGTADSGYRVCTDRVEVLERTGSRWSWREGPRLKQARRRHAAIVLPDGRLMVIGGEACHALRGLTSVETWDGKSESWKEEAPLPEAPADRSVAPRAYLVEGGSVLVLGARGMTFIWNPRSGRWTAGPMPGGGPVPYRAALVSTQLRDGTVVAVMKSETRETAMYALAPSAEKWRQIGPAPRAVPLATGQAATLPDGSVLFLGSGSAVDLLSENTLTLQPCAPPFGDADGSTLVALPDGRAALFGPDLSQVWDRSAAGEGAWTMRSTRGLPAGGKPVNGSFVRGAVLLPDGRVFENYGKQSRLWDPRADGYLPEVKAKIDRLAGFLAALPDGRVLLAGGAEEQIKGPSYEESVRAPESHATVFEEVHTKSAELFTPGASAWRATGPLTGYRISAASAVLPDGRVLAVGGTEDFWVEEVRDGRTVLTSDAPDRASAEIWSPKDDRWRPVAPMTTARSRPHTALLGDGRVFVVGGTHPHRSEPEVYDPRNDIWTKPAGAKPWGTSAAAVTLRDGRVLVVEGRAHDQAQGVPRFEAALWAPVAGQWTVTASPRYEVDGLTLLADGRVFHGGVQPEIWNPATGAWVTTAAPVARADIDSCPPLGLPDGRVLMCLEIWWPERKDRHGL